MEDNPKIFIVEYLSNQWSDLAQILNLSLYDQTKVEKYIKWRWPRMKMTLNGKQPQILIVEYLSNQWSDLPQILN